MKKIVLSMAAVLFGCGNLAAQTEAIKVTSDEIKINKPLSASTFNFKLAFCGLTIANSMEGGPSIGFTTNGSSTSSNTTSSITTPFHCGSICPEITNFMDLGSKDKYFRNSYIKQPYNKSAAQQVSDARYKENIKNLEASSEIIRRLHPVSFDFIRTDSLEDTASLKNKVGFLAQEMLDVLPHLVGKLPGTDLYVVDYTSVIPYLVKAFQEGQEEKTEMEGQIETLQDQIASLQELVQSLLAQNGTTPPAPNNAPKHGSKNNVKTARLFQNLPNPFSESTIIRYELPKTAGNAYIQVFDMGGRMVENIRLSHTQEIGQVELSAGELLPGTYTYSLIVSGKVIDSKRMVVTE